MYIWLKYLTIHDGLTVLSGGGGYVINGSTPTCIIGLVVAGAVILTGS